MRKLYEEIENFYLIQEAISKEPSSEIEVSKHARTRNTKLATHTRETEFEEPYKYHKDYSGITHEVDVQPNKSKDDLTPQYGRQTVSDMHHLHVHFIKHTADVGDVVRHTPILDKDRKVNRIGRLASKLAGFGNPQEITDMQHGIVRQYPHDHPDESKRGQKYLHPLHPEDIKAHGNKPTIAATNGKIRSYQGTG